VLTAGEPERVPDRFSSPIAFLVGVDIEGAVRLAVYEDLELASGG